MALINAFNQIINDLAHLDVKVEDNDKACILLCSLSSSYKHLVTTLTYVKDSISLETIQATLMSHSQWRQNAAGGEDLYVKEKKEHGRTQGKSFGGRMRKNSKSREHKKTMECYKCNQKGHLKRDCPKLKKFGEGTSRSANVAEIDNSNYYTEGDVYYSKGYVLTGSCS